MTKLLVFADARVKPHCVGWRMSSTRTAAVLLLAAAPCLAWAQSAPLVASSVITPKAPANSIYPDARAVNASGQMAGTAELKVGTIFGFLTIDGKLTLKSVAKTRAVPVVWSNTGVPTVLKPLSAGSKAAAYALNDLGWATGYSDKLFSPKNPVAVLWKDGKVIDLGVGSGPYSQGLAVNNKGAVLLYKDGYPLVHYGVWRGPGDLQWIEAPQGLDGFSCNGLSDDNVVLCHGHTKDAVWPSGYFNYVWDNGVLRPPTVPNLENVSFGLITRAGVIAGSGVDRTNAAPSSLRTFILRDGAITFLPALPGDWLDFGPMFVNDKGQAVGNVWHRDPDAPASVADIYARLNRTMLWTGAEYVELEPLIPGWTKLDQVYVNGLSNQGQVLVEVVSPTGVTRHLLIKP